MMNKKTYIFCIALIFAVSACGGGEAPATPALNAVDMQNTAMANAWLAMTQTQLAQPTVTATFIPAPTEPPTPSFIAIPTLPLAQPSPLVPLGNPTTNPCNDPAPARPVGATALVKFINKSEASASLSFGMLQPNAQGECGTYTLSLSRYDEPVVTVLAGCYWAFAYINKPSKPSNAENTQPLCVYNASDSVAIWITAEVINFH